MPTENQSVIDIIAGNTEPHDRFCVEKHGDAYALYCGRDDLHHGFRLCNLDDFDMSGEATRERIARALNVLDLLERDDLASTIAQECNDPHHDIRWCPTCSSRESGIEEYRDRLLRKRTESTNGNHP